uniref:Uncharacterized protein n=1 Tax=Romanomermis culicivorax TaxID=13658 RepID=A0A915JYP8_ROMCU
MLLAALAARNPNFLSVHYKVPPAIKTTELNYGIIIDDSDDDPKILNNYLSTCYRFEVIIFSWILSYIFEEYNTQLPDFFPRTNLSSVWLSSCLSLLFIEKKACIYHWQILYSLKNIDFCEQARQRRLKHWASVCH